MEIKTIASSSSGCCYCLTSRFGEHLLIEAGVSLKKIREFFQYDFKNVIGLIVSHEHGDHAKTLPEIEKKTSIKIWCSDGVKKRFHLNRSRDIKNKVIFKPSMGFEICPIDLEHDVLNFGFIIFSADSVVFYATDTASLENIRIPGITHLMIEANHSFEQLCESERNKYVVNRTANNHLDIDSAVEFASRHKERLREVHLIHLSDYHADEDLFKSKMQNATGVPVYIASKQ